MFIELPTEIIQYKAEVEAAIEAALSGGKAMLHFYKSKAMGVQKKEDGSRITKADMASHHEILKILKERFPDDPIVSEEDLAEKLKTDQTKKRIWVVDPLDGTNDFIDQTGEFCSQVGFAFEGKAVLGAIFQPDPGILYFGISDRGAWKVDFRLKDSQAQRLQIGLPTKKTLRFVRSRTHFDQKLSDLQKKLGKVEEIPCGSVGIKCALIAENGADLYVHPVPFLKEWDTCAPEAILRGAGGIVTDTKGKPLTYGKTNPAQTQGIFAAKKNVWEELSPLITSL